MYLLPLLNKQRNNWSWGQLQNEEAGGPVPALSGQLLLPSESPQKEQMELLYFSIPWSIMEQLTGKVHPNTSAQMDCHGNITIRSQKAQCCNWVWQEGF